MLCCFCSFSDRIASWTLRLSGPLLGQVEDLHVLLGDRGRALGRTAAGVVERRPDDALRVDAAVGVERAVLGGDHGVLQLSAACRSSGMICAVLRGVLPELGLAVAVVDERRLGLEVLVRVGDRRRLVEVDEAADQHQRADQGHDQEPLERRGGAAAWSFRAAARLARDGGALGPALGTHEVTPDVRRGIGARDGGPPLAPAAGCRPSGREYGAGPRAAETTRLALLIYRCDRLHR